MASKKSEKTSTKQVQPVKIAKRVAKAPKKAKTTIVAKARHPRARVLENHGTKEALAKSLAAVIARADQDTDALETQLKTASNAQLLRLSRVTATVKQKYGNRDKLIAAIGTAENKSKDKDYLARLETFSLPQLLDLATSAERRARA
jgi:enoyl-[acyl-carrier-protein] reductase (NADH)